MQNAKVIEFMASALALAAVLLLYNSSSYGWVAASASSMAWAYIAYNQGLGYMMITNIIIMIVNTEMAIKTLN